MTTNYQTLSTDICLEDSNFAHYRMRSIKSFVWEALNLARFLTSKSNCCISQMEQVGYKISSLFLSLLSSCRQIYKNHDYSLNIHLDAQVMMAAFKRKKSNYLWYTGPANWFNVWFMRQKKRFLSLFSTFCPWQPSQQCTN